MSYKQKKRLTLDLKTLILLVLCFITKSGVKPKLGKLNEGIDYSAPETLLGLAIYFRIRGKEIMRLFIGVSIVCLLALSTGAADVVADTTADYHPPTNKNTNVSASGSTNLVGISNSNLQHQTQIGSISDSFKAFDIDISESFRIEGNDTDIASDNTVASIVGNTDNFNDNIAFNDNNAIGNDDNFSDNAVGNDGNLVNNDNNANDNVVGNDNNAAFNDDNFSDNIVGNDGNIIGNDNNTINP